MDQGCLLADTREYPAWTQCRHTVLVSEEGGSGVRVMGDGTEGPAVQAAEVDGRGRAPGRGGGLWRLEKAESRFSSGGSRQEPGPAPTSVPARRPVSTF